MKKILSLVALTLLFCSPLFATHNRGAEITYRYIQGYEYEIKITTYTKLCNVCPDREYLDSVHLGDDVITRFNRNSFMDISGDSIRVNIYTLTHTYPADGVYGIYFADANRSEGIDNIPNSVNIPMCIEAYLVVLNPANYCVNNSAVFDASIAFEATVGKPFIYNLNATDPDHDSLSFQFTTPLRSSGVPVAGYTFPAGVTISPASGLITWNCPTQYGEYNFAVRVTEWRKDTVIGYVMRDFQVFVDNGADSANVFDPLVLSTDAQGNYFVSVNPGDTVNVHATYHQGGATFIPPITTYGEAFQMSSLPTVQYSTGPGTAMADFTWIPDSSKIRLHPYVFTFRGASGLFYTRRKDISFLVYVNGTPADTCPDFHLPSEWTYLPFQNFDMTLYPNPVSESLTIILNRSLVDSNHRIKIFDTTGRIVKRIDDLSASITFHRSSLAKGLYFISLEDQETVITTKKIVIH